MLRKNCTQELSRDRLAHQAHTRQNDDPCSVPATVVMAPMVREVHEMRVFQRGVDESLVIGDEVVVTVLEVLHDSVRLGITDPSGTPGYLEEDGRREEVEDRRALELRSIRRRSGRESEGGDQGSSAQGSLQHRGETVGFANRDSSGLCYLRKATE
ncbi:MAG: hypothetical protein B7Z55_15900 [Planctomycetales bacterium 12-60-4]|nr:MAG: hypothetical protein B7Z55_15900 [Planctomycetales bacterium 12-60-4]